MFLGKHFAALEVKIVVFSLEIEGTTVPQITGCPVSHLYVQEDLNLLQHLCVVGSNKLNKQKFRNCYCMDCNVSDSNARDDVPQTGVRTAVSHYHLVPFTKSGHRILFTFDSFTGVLYGVDWQIGSE